MDSHMNESKVLHSTLVEDAPDITISVKVPEAGITEEFVSRACIVWYSKEEDVPGCKPDFVSGMFVGGSRSEAIQGLICIAGEIMKALPEGLRTAIITRILSDAEIPHHVVGMPSNPGSGNVH